MSQNTDILRHLKRHGPITPQVALYSYGCMRLAARIEELRTAGHCILTEMVKDNGKRYAKYRLARARK